MKFQLRVAFVVAALFGNVETIWGHGDHGRIVARSKVDFDQYRYDTGGEYHHSESGHAQATRRHLETRSPKNINEIVKAWVQKEAPGSQYVVDAQYTDVDTGITHVYVVQTVGGVIVENARGNVHIKKDGTFFSGSIYFTTQSTPRLKGRSQLSPVAALSGALDTLGLKGEKQFDKAGLVSITSAKPLSPVDAKYTIEGVAHTPEAPTMKLAYLAGPNGLDSVYVADYKDDFQNWVHIVTDAVEQGKVYIVSNYVKDAKYLVYKLGVNDPSDGSRTVEVDPFKKEESPYGWHATKTKKYTQVKGNNGYAIFNFDADEEIDFIKAPSPDGKSELKFEYKFDQNEKDPKKWADAAAVQVFYTSNLFHDLLEQLGFSDVSGNFEETPTAGKGGDAPILNIQYGFDTGDPEFRNNANFGTPVDGKRPVMRMYIWDAVSSKTGAPVLDSSFDNGVIIHEYAHGLSNRLTGGPANAQCLEAFESGGMGEGWGDFFATAIRLKKKDNRNTDYGVGTYLMNNTVGIREYVYSTNMKTNPLVYSQLNDPEWLQRVHSGGAVWASILYEVLWNLIDTYGMTEEIFPVFHKGTKTPVDGRNLAMKLVLEGMKLQPCNPSFIGARNAIIDADIALTGGKNWCSLWKGFAKRGLGYDVKRGKNKDGSLAIVDGFKLPDDCKA